MDTQPCRTCSEGYIFLLLYATVVFLCIWGVLTRLDKPSLQIPAFWGLCVKSEIVIDEAHYTGQQIRRRTGGGGAGAQKLVTCGTQGLIGRYQIMPFSAHMAPTDLSSSMRELRIMNYGIL
jgi:hypothetical protein